MSYTMHLVHFSSIMLWLIFTLLCLPKLCQDLVGLSVVTSPNTNTYLIHSPVLLWMEWRPVCKEKKKCWHINTINSSCSLAWKNVSSVACLPLTFVFSYPALWPQNMSLRPLGPTTKRWIHWQTKHPLLRGGPLGPAGHSTCCNWCCSIAWCCPSSSVPQPCCSVWCSRGRCTGSAVCY